MSRLSPAAVAALAETLSKAYAGPTGSTNLARLLLQLTPERNYDNLTSNRLPLTTQAWEITTQAQDQGWSGELLKALLEDRPNNAAVRALAELNLKLIEGPAISHQRSPVDRPSLVCDRSSQWNYVCQCAISRTHQAIIVPGCIGQATLHFRDRIESFLSTDPSRSIVTVHWPSPPPRALGELLERLAFALQIDVTNLEQAILDRLATRNLVVLHPCLSAGFRGAHFLEYYTKWWPAAIGKAQTPYHVKCVQPVEWPINPSSSQPWWRRLLPDDEPAVELEARELIEHLTKDAKGVRIVAVDELLNLERGDIDQFLEASEFDDAQRQYLSGLLIGGPQVPVVIFKTIDDYWREVSGIQ